MQRSVMKEKVYFSGQNVNEGFYICENCGQKLYFNNGDKLMECPKCTNKTFTKQ